MQAQLAYSANNSKWIMPQLYQSHIFQASGVSLQLNQLDATPFMATYAHPPNTAYYHNEFQSRVRSITNSNVLMLY